MKTAVYLAKWIIRADGVILTKTGGGAPEVFMAWTAQRCEEMGIKTAIAQLHMSADPVYTRFDYSINYNMPQVNAIISMGTPNAAIMLPAMERVIGKKVPIPGKPPAGAEHETILLWIKGIGCQLGNSRLSLTSY